MKCPDVGMFQAYIDEELDAGMNSEIKNHLLTCDLCRHTLDDLQGTHGFVMERMGEYRDLVGQEVEMEIKASKNKKLNLMKGVENFMKTYKKIGIAACLILALTVSMTVAPVRAAIADALSIFRAERVEGLKITMQDINEIRSKLEAQEGEINLDNVGKINHHGGQQKDITLEEAKAIQDFQVLIPADVSGENLQVSKVEPTSIEFTLNVENVNDILKTFSATTLLPQNIDGKTFSVGLSTQVYINYQKDGQYYSMIQSKSPEIIVPEGVNVDEVYNCLIDLPILPSRLKEQLRGMDDWKNTLYFPYTEFEEGQQVDINGSKGYMVSNTRQQESQYSTLIWQQDGVIYGIQSSASQNEVIDLAKSMR